MPDQTQHQKPLLVGEDGELLQADMTVDPEAYSEYVATYVRRDPLWVRMQRHFQMYDGVYLFFSPWIFLFVLVIINSLLTSWQNELLSFIFYGAPVVIFVVAVSRLAFKARTHR